MFIYIVREEVVSAVVSLLCHDATSRAFSDVYAVSSW